MIYVQIMKENQIWYKQQTELQAPDLGQADTECCGVKIV